MITQNLFDAFLVCPTKFHLLSAGTSTQGNEYSRWYGNWCEAYRQKNVRKLLDDISVEIATSKSLAYLWRNSTWDYLVSPVVRFGNLEVVPQLIQRVQRKRPSKSISFFPVRYRPENKITRIQKLSIAFEAYVISKAIRAKIDRAIFIHGDKCSKLTIDSSKLSNAVQQVVRRIESEFTKEAPGYLLNRHCAECEFRDYCRKRAAEIDELTLLSNFSISERARLNRNGIFTVNQLSYKFRPRRRSKHKIAKPEKFHQPLRALAIREGKIHLVGNPKLSISGTPVFFDVEGLPDRDFYYLLGIQVGEAQDNFRRHFWANTCTEEELVWKAFLSFLTTIEDPQLIHYGSFEATYIAKMIKRYGAPAEDSSAYQAIANPINLLSIIYAKIYFPTYSNGLKEIANYLGFTWSKSGTSGLDSIVWRHQWESINSTDLYKRLVNYNAEDCEALGLVTTVLHRILRHDHDHGQDESLLLDVVNTNSLQKNLLSKWSKFQSSVTDFEYINKTAHWDYQRDRVFIRSKDFKRKKKRQHTNKSATLTADITISATAPPRCPRCGDTRRENGRYVSKVVQDLVFGRDSIKRRAVRYNYQSYRCINCQHNYGLHDWYFHARKWGWNLAAYFIYHIIGLGLPQLTVQHHLNRIFGLGLVRSTLNNFKIKAADQYLATRARILHRIINGDLIHADETRANIKGFQAYVWVLTNYHEVVYLLSDSREGNTIRELLQDFNGVLVSDFYAAYESINCPQQKCLIHLIRDLNDEIHNNPFDDELKAMALSFADVLRAIVETIDKFGLKKRFLRKHKTAADKFFKSLQKIECNSETSEKCRKRFMKNRKVLFTFLDHDGIPWNNNNAEHAVKAFARLREVVAGSSSKKGINEYLTLLSVAQTCKYQNIDFLDFLRSGELYIDQFAGKRG